MKWPRRKKPRWRGKVSKVRLSGEWVAICYDETRPNRAVCWAVSTWRQPIAFRMIGDHMRTQHH